MRANALLTACVLLAFSLALPASGAPAGMKVADDYLPRVDPGYELVAAAPDSRLALGLEDRMMRDAAKLTGLKLDYIFRVRVGMQRRFLLTNDWNEQAQEPGPSYVEESDLKLKSGADSAEPGVPYPQESYIAAGYDTSPDSGAGGAEARPDLWRVTLVSLTKSAAGGVVVQDSWSSDWPGCGYLYAMDFNSDGLVDLACSLFGGASSGGGVALLTVEPAGKLRQFSFEDGGSGETSSAFGHLRPLSLKQDGTWQLELCAFPLVFTASGLNGYDLLVYDQASDGWVDGSEAFPAYDDEQVAFFRALTGLLAKAHADSGLLQRVDDDACLPVDGLLYRVGFYDHDTGVLQDLLSPEAIIDELRDSEHLARAWERADVH